MNKKKRIILWIVGLVLFVSVILSLRILRKSEKMVIEIVQDKKVLYTIDLASAEDQFLNIPSPDGKSYNIVKIEAGSVCVSEAGCPDKTCVKMGKLQSDALPIVCLPNRLMIRYAGEENS